MKKGGRYHYSGCYCEACGNPTSNQKQAESQRRRKENRVLVDGRLVHPDAPHGYESGYQGFGCRCLECVATSTAARRERRYRKYRAERVVGEGGVLVHPRARHGTRAGYVTYGCECALCSAVGETEGRG